MTRKSSTLAAALLAAGFVFSSASFAQMSRDEYSAAKNRIEDNRKAAMEACDGLSGNKKDICEAEAKGKEKVEKAELEASYKPTAKNQQDARIAKAEADYEVAKERCDDLSGNQKDVCLKDAKAAETAAKADAKAMKKSSDARADSVEKSSESRTEARREAAEARKDAAEDKRDAQYEAARERCDSLSGNAKDDCVARAKAQYGK